MTTHYIAHNPIPCPASEICAKHSMGVLCISGDEVRALSRLVIGKSEQKRINNKINSQKKNIHSLRYRLSSVRI